MKTAKDVPLDTTMLGAIGYCFGGATVLELARSGADLDAVRDLPRWPEHRDARATRHGEGERPRLNGADDQGTKGRLPAFEDEMRRRGVDWQFVNFGGAVHCFALPMAEQAAGLRYNELAARRAERMMRVFLAERVRERRNRRAKSRGGFSEPAATAVTGRRVPRSRIDRSRFRRMPESAPSPPRCANSDGALPAVAQTAARRGSRPPPPASRRRRHAVDRVAQHAPASRHRMCDRVDQRQRRLAFGRGRRRGSCPACPASAA